MAKEGVLMANGKGTGWTDDRIALLGKLWAEGMKAGDIANRLGGVSRNAIIGKIHRCGFTAPTKIHLSIKRRKRKTLSPGGSRTTGGSRATGGADVYLLASAPKRGKSFKTAALHDCDPPPSERISLLQLMRDTCKWPLGDPGDHGFAFCGRGKPLDGDPYCEAHAALAYVKPARKHPAPDRPYQLTKHEAA